MNKNQRSSGQGSLWISIVVGIIFTGVGLLVGVGAIANQDWLLAIIFGGVFLAAGLSMLGYGGLGLYGRALLGHPQITLTQTELPVGGTTYFSLQHTFPSSITTEKIHLKLIMREIATYKQGTKTRTVTHEDVVDEEEWPGQVYSEGQTIYLQRDLSIPRDGMHSFKVTRNEIQWLCQFVIGLPGLPDYTDEVVLNVLPQVVRK